MVGIEFITNVEADILIDGNVVSRTIWNPSRHRFVVVFVGDIGGAYLSLMSHTFHAVSPGYKTSTYWIDRVGVTTPTNNNPFTYSTRDDWNYTICFVFVSTKKTVTVTATVSKGYPSPSIDISIFVDSFAVINNHWDVVEKGSSVSLPVEIIAVGQHDVFARAMLNNDFGSVTADSQHVTVTV